MTEEKCCKGKEPKKCSPEKIEECHGDAKKHPCETKYKGKESKK